MPALIMDDRNGGRKANANIFVSGLAILLPLANTVFTPRRGLLGVLTMHDWKHLDNRVISTRYQRDITPISSRYQTTLEGIGCLLIGAAFGGLLAWGAFL
jgi:hypothetical protein